MFKTNFPKVFPPVSVRENTVAGVREGYQQSCSVKPEEATVLSRLWPDDYPKSSANTFYVAPNGSDDADGSAAAPFATIGCALEKAAHGGTVILADGSYTLTKSICIGSAQSGIKNAPVFITAQKGAEPRLSTGRVIPVSALVRAEAAPFVTPSQIERLNRFIPDNAKNILACDLAALGFTADDFAPYRSGEVDPCLLIDDNNCIPARWPNKDTNDEQLGIRNGSIRTVSHPDGMSHIKKVGNVQAGISNLYYDHKYEKGGWEIYIDDADYRDRISAYDTASSGLFMYGSVYEEWDNHRFHLHLEKDEAGRSYLRSEIPAYYGAKENSQNRLFFFNVLEELDTDGEFLIDYDRMLLFVYAKDALDGRTVTLATAETPLFCLDGASYVVLDSLTFCRSAGYGVYAKDCSNIVIQSCRFDGINKHSIFLCDCSFSAITYCDFIRSFGVLIEAPRLTKEFLPTVNAIQNNHFRNAGEVAARQIGLMFSGVGDIISHNRFYETMLYVRRAYETIIEYNEMERGSQHVRDNGPIYTNDDSRGVHIRHNLVHSLNYSLYGIYLDDCSSGLYVYNNVIHYDKSISANAKCINLHNGNMNVIKNNLCIGSTTAAIQNNINYYAKTVNGVPTGGGSLSYRWESIAKQRLTINYHYPNAEKMSACYPMYKWFIDIVDRTIEKMNPDNGWMHSEKYSPADDEELFTRMPVFNIYEGNLFCDCQSGLSIPEIGRSTCAVSNNASCNKETAYEFIRPSLKKMGLTFALTE